MEAPFCVKARVGARTFRFIPGGKTIKITGHGTASQDRETKMEGAIIFLRRQLRRQLTDAQSGREEGIFKWQSAGKTYIREATAGGKDGISRDADRMENWFTVMCMPGNTMNARRGLNRPKRGTGMRGTRLRNAGRERSVTLSCTGFTASQSRT